MHRQTFIFLLSHKITTVQQKTKTKLHQTTTTNNPHNHSIKNTQKTNRQNKHEKLSHQSIVKSITENNRNKQQSTQPLDKKHPKTTTTSSYEKMQYF